jgi:amidase
MSLISISDEKVIHTMSPQNEPLATIQTGETVVIKTRAPGIADAVFDADYSEGSYPKRILSITGPIYVADCEPGDVLEVSIHSIDLDPEGKMWMGQWMGILMDEVTKPYLKKVKVVGSEVIFNDRIKFPVKPMIGTIGVAPVEAIDCLYPGRHGGNMDVLSIAPGSKVYLPVQVSGGLLAIGDVHAAMGEGEVLGTGIEIGSTVTATVRVIKNCQLAHPLVETPDTYEIIVSDPDIMEACREATRTMIQMFREKLRLSFEEAYALTGQCGNLRICQVVNPIATVRFEFPKRILEASLVKEG